MRGAWWTTEGELDEYQKKIMSLGAEGNHLITGPPGSGKTNLLLLRAKYLTRLGRPNLKVLVFGRALKEFIAAGGTEYDLPADRVNTCIGWMGEVLREFGTMPPEAKNFEEHRVSLLRAVGDVIKERSLAKIVDVLLLDEAQDYTDEEIDLFAQLSTNVFAAADVRQQIYRKRAASLTGLTSICGAPVPLKFHYRCGTKICRLADGIAKYTAEHERLEKTSNYDEAARPSAVNVVPNLSLQDQGRQIIESLRLQLRTYPGELLGVICPLKDQLQPLWKIVSSAADIAPLAVCQSAEEGYTPFLPETQICVSTVHGAKGLEFRTLHFAGADGVTRHMSVQRNLAYTAVTRAKTSLSIYHEGQLPAFFESAVAGLSPPKRNPDIRDLFGGKH